MCVHKKLTLLHQKLRLRLETNTKDKVNRQESKCRLPICRI